MFCFIGNGLKAALGSGEEETVSSRDSAPWAKSAGPWAGQSFGALILQTK